MDRFRFDYFDFDSWRLKEWNWFIVPTWYFIKFSHHFEIDRILELEIFATAALVDLWFMWSECWLAQKSVLNQHFLKVYIFLVFKSWLNIEDNQLLNNDENVVMIDRKNYVSMIRCLCALLCWLYWNPSPRKTVATACEFSS